MNTDRKITLIGLGNGDPQNLTRAAWDCLHQSSMLLVRSKRHPNLKGLPGDVQIVEIPIDLEQQPEPADFVKSAAEYIVHAVEENGEATYAVPGDPSESDAISLEVIRLAQENDIEVNLIPGIGLGTIAIAKMEWTSPVRKGTLAQIDALELASLHTPPFAPTSRAMIAQIDSLSLAHRVKETLLAVYPPVHPLNVIFENGTDPVLVSLDHLDRLEGFSPYTIATLPPLGEDTSLEAFQEIIAHLRAPNGCPWDRQQTHLTLRKHLLEETYETLEALDASDTAAMVEEFGDLLLQIVLHAQIASEDGEFTMADIIQGISEKIIRRHPHVFGEIEVEGVSGVLQNWEKLKAAEREANGEENGKKGFLDGVPPALPALSQAYELQDRAARVGFDWNDIQGVVDKVREELDEVLSAPDKRAKTSELGDLLFAVVNLARWEKVDAESALRETNLRFRRRFSFIESEAKAQGSSMSDLSVDEMNRLWEAAKEKEKDQE